MAAVCQERGSGAGRRRKDWREIWAAKPAVQEVQEVQRAMCDARGQCIKQSGSSESERREARQAGGHAEEKARRLSAIMKG